MGKDTFIEVGSFGITVNNILPGYTNTNRLKSLIIKAETENQGNQKSYFKIMKSQVPASRFGEANEVANAVAFLCTPAASYINGIQFTSRWWKNKEFISGKDFKLYKWRISRTR